MTNSQNPFLRLHPEDNVFVALSLVPPHTNVRETSYPPVDFTTQETLLTGHKVACCDIRQGSPIIKYGETIGVASENIKSGQWVHTHNVERKEIDLVHNFCSERPSVPDIDEPKTFFGYKRKDGRVGTRNYIAIISTVNCSATTAKAIVRNLSPSILDQFPNVDGVFPVTTSMGMCNWLRR